MSARTFIVNSARPGPTLEIRIPIACDARSRENISAATRSASDCASAEVRGASAATDVSGSVIAIEHREVLAATYPIRHSRESGNPVSFDQRHWVPAWPFLETSPCGLVFAGTTILYESRYPFL